MIYLDNAASTKVLNTVFAEAVPYIKDTYANPSSIHSFGKSAKKAIEKAREQVAKAINAEPRQIVFTSGASESNSWVLRNQRYAICSPYEHHSVSKNAHIVHYNNDFQFSERLHFLRPSLVSHIMTSNETGEIYDIKNLCKISHMRDVKLHTDATQAFSHIPIDVRDLDVDFLSMSGHKFHAPRGTGILYIKDPDNFKPLIKGGGQERGLRAGTENTFAIVGVGKACELYNYDKNEQDKIALLRDNFEQKILENVSDVLINAKDKPRVGNISSLSFKGIEGEALMLQLDHKGICVSSGSACNSGSLEPSHVLQAMGIPDDYIYGTIRVSLSRYTTQEELDYAADCIIEIVNNLRV